MAGGIIPCITHIIVGSIVGIIRIILGTIGMIGGVQVGVVGNSMYNQAY